MMHTNNVYDLHYKNIPVPEGYDTIKWHMEVEILTGLDSIYTQYMIFSEKLKNLLVEDESCALNKSDFINAFGLPSSEGFSIPTSAYYHFNTRRHPDCYNPQKLTLNKYEKCSHILFRFDSNYNLKNVSTNGFYP